MNISHSKCIRLSYIHVYELEDVVFFILDPVLISLLIDTQNCLSDVAYFTKLVFISIFILN